MNAFVRHTAALAVAGGLALSARGPVTAQQPAAAPQTPPGPAAPAAAPQEPGRGGGRGGRVNPSAVIYTERCAACHGTETATGRAPNLFDDQWGRASHDEGIAAVIADGIPQT
jgi:cytochrome c5